MPSIVGHRGRWGALGPALAVTILLLGSSCTTAPPPATGPAGPGDSAPTSLVPPPESRPRQVAREVWTVETSTKTTAGPALYAGGSVSLRAGCTGPESIEIAVVDSSVSADPDDDPLWTQSVPCTGTGQLVRTTLPAHSEVPVTLTVDDGPGSSEFWAILADG